MNSEFINRVIELTNQERARVGLAPLTFNPQLAEAAQLHVENMASQDFFSHTGLDGTEPWDRVQATGYNYSTVAENIAAGQRTPEEVVVAWMESDGHRANILNPDIQEIGIGYFFLGNDTGDINYNHYWGQVFGSPVNGIVSNASLSAATLDSIATTSLVDAATAFLLGSDVIDQLTGTINNDTILAFSGNDVVTGSSGNDYINGNLDNDRLFGDLGNDTIRGGQGSDFVRGGEGNDEVFGDRGNDQVFGDNGDDILYGGQNEDYLDGGNGNDILYGDLGSDVMIGGAGADVFVLRTGAPDLIFYNDADDFIGLTGGLSFDNLSITAGLGDLLNATVISLQGSSPELNGVLAILPNVSPGQLDAGDFVLL